MATQDDRSLGAGSFFPKWMKTKMDNKFDLNQSAFSPTELDDSFMYYYRHNNNGHTQQVNNMESKVVTASKQITSGQADFSNITAVDQSLLNNKVSTVPPVCANSKPKTKPKGTDDGFKGETARVGSTVVRVANQMVSGKLNKGVATPQPEEECEQLLAKFDPYRRRGSKSLPASPLVTPDTSPKSKRRVNKYFTSPYVDAEKAKGSWILSNLLAKREISKSFNHINEETRDEVDRACSTASIDELGGTTSTKQLKNVYKAKPSELREMNFWSPTSM